MTWQIFTHPASGKTERWLRFRGAENARSTQGDRISAIVNQLKMSQTLAVTSFWAFDFNQ